MKKFLLDTNTLIYLHNDRLENSLPEGYFAYSVISEIELLSWPEMKSELEHELRGMLAAFRRIDINAAVRETAIRVRREHRLKLPDALIAACAIHFDAVLLTNDQQLGNVPGLRCQPLELKSV